MTYLDNRGLFERLRNPYARAVEEADQEFNAMVQPRQPTTRDPIPPPPQPRTPMPAIGLPPPRLTRRIQDSEMNRLQWEVRQRIAVALFDVDTRGATFGKDARSYHDPERSALRRFLWRWKTMRRMRAFRTTFPCDITVRIDPNAHHNPFKGRSGRVVFAPVAEMWTRPDADIVQIELFGGVASDIAYSVTASIYDLVIITNTREVEVERSLWNQHWRAKYSDQMRADLVRAVMTPKAEKKEKVTLDEPTPEIQAVVHRPRRRLIVD